jgi:hypothetical protein
MKGKPDFWLGRKYKGEGEKEEGRGRNESGTYQEYRTYGWDMSGKREEKE